MMTAKTITPCLPPPLAPDRHASVSLQTARSCGALWKIPHLLKSCASSQGGWSLWWRRRSQKGDGGEEAALVVELLLRRQPWTRTLLYLWRNQAKTPLYRALTIKLRGPTLLRTKTLLLASLCTHSLSEVILHIHHPIFLLTCLC